MKTNRPWPAALLLLLSLSAFRNPGSGINEKVLQSFQAAFPGAMQVSWREEAEHYFVHFTQASAVSGIEYDQDGNFISSFRYYKSPELLPVHIICKLNKKFKDKTIFGITEFSTGSETNYYIKLEDPQRFTTIRAGEDGSLVVIEKFRKQAG